MIIYMMTHPKNIKDLYMKLPNWNPIKNILEKRIFGNLKYSQKTVNVKEELEQELKVIGEHTLVPPDFSPSESRSKGHDIIKE